MTRTSSWVGGLAFAALSAAACGDDAFVYYPPAIDDNDGGMAGSPGGSSAGGSGAGTDGSSAGTSGSAGGTGVSPVGAGVGPVRVGDSGAPDAGGSDASIVAPEPGDAGVCTEPACECAVDVITALPYTELWQTTDDTEADLVDIEDCQLCDNTADHIVTFTAPAAATYRFFASSGGDVELAVYTGNCTAAPNDVSCGEDLDSDDEDYNDQVDVEIAQGETVTVVVGESCEENGGAGTLTIQVAP